MRICFLGHGNSVHIKRWLEYFRDRGHDVYLITFADTSINGVNVYNVGSFNIKANGGNWQYIRKLSSIKKLLKEIQPDIINAHYVTSYGFIGALTGYTPLVLSAWGSDILVTPKENVLYKSITKYALNRADLITSDSLYMTREIQKLTQRKTITVPMGVEKNLCYMDRKESEDEIRILSLRSIDKNSNIDLIVKAFSILIKKYDYKNARLIIVNDGPEIDNIRKLIKDEGIQNNVEVKGFVSRSELLDLLLSSNIYISIPTSDSTSVTLLEAMACGIMNIVSDIPANTEWIEDGVNGIILKGNQPEHIAKGIKNAIGDLELKQKCISLNRDIILKRAIWEDNMGQIEQEYEKLQKKKESK